MLDEQKLKDLREDIDDFENSISDDVERKIEKTSLEIEDSLDSMECLINNICKCPNCQTITTNKELIAFENQCSNCVGSGSGSGGTILNNTEASYSESDTFFIEENEESMEGVISTVGRGIRKGAIAIKDLIVSFFKLIWNVIKAIGRFFKNVWKSLFGKYERILSKVEYIKKKAKNIASSEKLGEFVIDDDLREDESLNKSFFGNSKDFINYKGSVKEEDLLKGLDVFADFVSSFTASYKDWLKDESHIKKTIKAFYKPDTSKKSIFDKMFKKDLGPVIIPSFKSFTKANPNNYTLSENLKTAVSNTNVFHVSEEFFNGKAIGLIFPNYENIEKVEEMTAISSSTAGICQLKSYKVNKTNKYPIFKKSDIDFSCDVLIKAIKEIIDIEDGLYKANNLEDEFSKLNRNLLNKAKDSDENYTLKEDLKLLLNQLRSFSRFITQIPVNILNHSSVVINSFIHLMNKSIDIRLDKINKEDRK